MRYRIVTAGRAARSHYDVTLGPGEKAVFRAAGSPFVPCGSRSLSLPINAKSGREFGAFDVGRGTNGIIEVLPNGTCRDLLDLGFASGKISFSYDGARVAFSTSRINVDTAGRHEPTRRFTRTRCAQARPAPCELTRTSAAAASFPSSCRRRHHALDSRALYRGGGYGGSSR